MPLAVRYDVDEFRQHLGSDRKTVTALTQGRSQCSSRRMLLMTGDFQRDEECRVESVPYPRPSNRYCERTNLATLTK